MVAIEMASVTIRNLSKTTHRLLKIRAARNGRSLEEEVRQILQDAVSPRPRIKIGSELAALGRRFGGIELNYKRDKRPAEPANFD
jgi:plasmid stability protein